RVEQERRRGHDLVARLQALDDLDERVARSPTRTSRGTNRPSPRFTKTRTFVPVRSTASSGTLTLRRPAVARAAVAYISGRKAPSPFSTATRAVSVRVFSSSCG